MSARMMATREKSTMGLKAPGLLTFMLSVIIVVCVLMAKFFNASIPFVSGYELWAVLTAYVFLMVGCIVRGL